MENLSREAFLEEWKRVYLFREPMTSAEKTHVTQQLADTVVSHMGDTHALDGLFAETVPPFMVTTEAIAQKLSDVHQGILTLGQTIAAKYLEKRMPEIVEMVRMRNLRHGFTFLRQMSDGADLPVSGVRPVELHLERLCEALNEGRFDGMLLSVSFPDRQSLGPALSAAKENLHELVEWEIGALRDSKAKLDEREIAQVKRMKEMLSILNEAINARISQMRGVSP
jgi:hypothetical protein